MESRTQGWRPKPRTEKKIRDQGQGQPYRGQTLSRPRGGMLEAKNTSASVLKKKGLHKNFSGDLQKKTLCKKFSGAPQTFNNSKNSAVLEPRQAEDRAIFEDLRIRGQGQGLQNVSLRPKTSSRTPPLITALALFFWLGVLYSAKASVSIGNFCFGRRYNYEYNGELIFFRIVSRSSRVERI